MVDYWATTMGNWPLVSWPLVSWSLVSFLLGLSPGVDGGQSGLPHSHSQKRHHQQRRSPSGPARLHTIGSLSWFISR